MVTHIYIQTVTISTKTFIRICMLNCHNNKEIRRKTQTNNVSSTSSINKQYTRDTLRNDLLKLKFIASRRHTHNIHHHSKQRGNLLREKKRVKKKRRNWNKNQIKCKLNDNIRQAYHVLNGVSFLIMTRMMAFSFLSYKFLFVFVFYLCISSSVSTKWISVDYISMNAM